MTFLKSCKWPFQKECKWPYQKACKWTYQKACISPYQNACLNDLIKSHVNYLIKKHVNDLTWENIYIKPFWFINVFEEILFNLSSTLVIIKVYQTRDSDPSVLPDRSWSFGYWSTWKCNKARNLLTSLQIVG